MKDWKGTKGEWFVKTAFKGESENIVIKTDNAIITVEDKNRVAVGIFGRVEEKECKANAWLMADAGNTIQKCGLFPSEILDQHDKLFVMVVKMRLELEEKGNYTLVEEANELINKIQNGY